MNMVRQPAVAGMFYPDNPVTLKNEVNAYLQQAASDEPAPKAFIAPHAGYVYSAPIAASVYARLQKRRDDIRTVILLGPTHRVAFSGLALSSASAYHTPLGDVAIDLEKQAALIKLPQVKYLDAAHANEHSLEVHLPFLQVILANFSIVPIVVGETQPEEVSEVLECLWGGPETVCVISSDLSHYLDYDTAKRLDSAASKAIETLNPNGINQEMACGRNPIKGLLHYAKKINLQARTVDLRNSGDTAGSKDRVVGYGAYVFN